MTGKKKLNVALIFAGGTGKRMNTHGVPKQFLELYGKPIIVYTLEKFENHDEIDGIVISCLKDYIPKMWKLCSKFHITKVQAIVPGGETGQESIYHGLCKIDELYPDNAVVLVHDGVRPLVDPMTITKAIACVREHGSAITVTPATETIIIKRTGEEAAGEAEEEMTGGASGAGAGERTAAAKAGGADELGEILDRSACEVAKAPQCFYVSDLLEVHERARKEGREDFIDSASLMRHYGHKLYSVEGRTENIKITTPVDYYIFKAIETAKESSNAFGL